MFKEQVLRRPSSQTAKRPEPDAARRIISAARHHFFVHGFRGVSMDELAEQVGMSKKTLYTHFAAKRELLEAVLRQKFDELDAELERVSAECARDIVRGIRELLQCMQHQVQEIQPPFVRDVRREAPEVFDFVKKRRRAAFSRCFTTLLQSGRKAGLVRNDLALPTTIEILLAATDAIINPRKLEQLKLTPHRAYSQIISIFLDGALTEKGRRTLRASAKSGGRRR